MQDITILNNTRKATKLGMKVSRDKQCFKHTICSHAQCLLSWSPSFADASLLEQQLSFHPPFQSFHPSSNSTFIEQKCLHSRKILNGRYSLFKMIVISNTPTASTWHDFRRKLHKLFFQFLFQVNYNFFHGTTSRY